MLTQPANGANSAPRAVMWSIADVANRDGVSKPTVSIRVKRFVERHGLTVERDMQGRVIALNVAEYDALRGKYDDPSKSQASAPPPSVRASARAELVDSESYDEALRQKTWIEAEQKRLTLDQARGKLVEAAGVADGYDRAAVVIRDVVLRLEEHGDDLASIVAKEGARGLRQALKAISQELLREVSEGLAEESKILRAAMVDEEPRIQ